MKIDVSRPDVMYALIWISTPLLAYFDLYYMGFDSSAVITSLIAGNVVSFFVVYQAARLYEERRRRQQPRSAEAELPKLWTIDLWLCALWSALFVIIVVRSHGVPLWWRLAHIDRSYVDFGVPTLSGFANMLRSLILCLSVLIWLASGRRGALVIIAVLVLGSLVEMARANTIYLLLCGAGVYFIRRSMSARMLAILIAFSIAFVLLFGVVERYRSPGGSGGEGYLKYPSILNRLPYGVTDVYFYVSTPVANLYYAQSHGGVKSLHYPYYTLQLMVPTIVRSKIYEPHEYPIALRVASFNATTFYAPFIADFGMGIAGALVILIQGVVSLVHVRARHGDVFYQLIYGPLFAALMLSFFFNYFLTMGVWAFAILVMLLRLASVEKHAAPVFGVR